jgi:hypothetical protein
LYPVIDPAAENICAGSTIYISTSKKLGLGDLDRGIQPENTPWKETGRTRLEFSALLDTKLLSA